MKKDYTPLFKAANKSLVLSVTYPPLFILKSPEIISSLEYVKKGVDGIVSDKQDILMRVNA